MTFSSWGIAYAGLLVLAAGCTSFDTLAGVDAGDAGGMTTGDVGTSRADTGARDGGRARHDATREDGATDAAIDAPASVDTACAFPWSEGGCSGRTTSAVGSIQFSDDPRISFARSAGGELALCYGNVSEDFLTRSLSLVLLRPPTAATPAAPTAATVFDGVESDSTPACGLGGSAGLAFHLLFTDTDLSVVDYGLVAPGTTTTFQPFGPGTDDGFVTLGVRELDPTHVLAAIGLGSTGTIASYVGSVTGGAVAFAPPSTVESGISPLVTGAGAFSLQSGKSPSILIDMQPADASSSAAELAVLTGSSWSLATVESDTRDGSVVGYSPSLATQDGGVTAVYYERDLGTADAGTSQIHVATGAGSQFTIARPLPATPDNDPNNPLVGASAAIGPDGRLFIAYVASPSPGKVVLYLARPESTLAGAPYIIDTIDDRLSEPDALSVNLIVDPSGRIDVVYMRQTAGSVYFATRDP